MPYLCDVWSPVDPDEEPCDDLVVVEFCKFRVDRYGNYADGDDRRASEVDYDHVRAECQNCDAEASWYSAGLPYMDAVNSRRNLAGFRYCDRCEVWQRGTHYQDSPECHAHAHDIDECPCGDPPERDTTMDTRTTTYRGLGSLISHA